MCDSKVLYQQLMVLCEDINKDNPFYYKDFPTSGEFYTGDIVDTLIYRVFNYRLAQHSDWIKPAALFCRGTMYLVDRLTGGATIASRTMEKFFNLTELQNEHLTIEDLIKDADVVMDKRDGSLINTYIDVNGDLKLKSKGSLSSEQAVDAMQWLDKACNLEFKNNIQFAVGMGFTINLEWTSASNRIVIGYDKPELKVLNMIENKSGEYVNLRGLLKIFQKEDCVDVINDKSQIRSYRTQTGNEGYVVRLVDGTHVKLKTDEYITLHHNKDNVNSPRRLFEACIDECTDDLKQMFTDDAQALTTIVAMEAVAAHAYNGLISNVSLFYGVHKRMQRKEYALLAQDVLPKIEFGLAMSAYCNKPIDYKAVCKKNWRLYVGGE